MAFYRDLPASIPPRKCSESEIYVPGTHPFLFWARRHDQGMNGMLPPDIQSSKSRLPTISSAGCIDDTTKGRAKGGKRTARLHPRQ